MSSTEESTGDGDGDRATGTALPAVVDWLLAVAVILGGLTLIVGGSALVFVVDRALVAESVEAGTLTVTLVTTELTGAQAVDFVMATLTWTAWGLLLTGAAMVLFGIGYGIRRYRTRRRAAPGTSVSSFGANALLGAVVSGLLFFVPFSTAIGGGVAGYVERGASDRVVSVGALAGLLAMAPVLAILLFVLGGLVAATAGVGEAGLGVFVGLVMLLVLMVVATIGAGLGALGGYLGGAVADRES